jgi:N-acyl amino acid synthase of PEP-CTERM/exosortase system
MLSAFPGLVIDDLPELLAASHRLRYEVYCDERRFLPPEHYPDGLERDAFDAHSVHLGVLNSRGELIAGARLVQPRGTGLPLSRYCTLFPGEPSLLDPSRRIVEISRVLVSRSYTRRAGDGYYGLPDPETGTCGSERRGSADVGLALYRTIYQVSKRHGFTHWVIAAETSLRRLLKRHGLHFRPVGPESDYYGLVAPCLLEIQKFEAVIASGRVPLLAGFLVGLEPEYWPAGCRARSGTGTHEQPPGAG